MVQKCVNVTDALSHELVIALSNYFCHRLLICYGENSPP
jgi:hypothetical protein